MMNQDEIDKLMQGLDEEEPSRGSGEWIAPACLACFVVLLALVASVILGGWRP